MSQSNQYYSKSSLVNAITDPAHDLRLVEALQTGRDSLVETHQPDFDTAVEVAHLLDIAKPDTHHVNIQWKTDL